MKVTLYVAVFFILSSFALGDRLVCDSNVNGVDLQHGITTCDSSGNCDECYINGAEGNGAVVIRQIDHISDWTNYDKFDAQVPLMSFCANENTLVIPQCGSENLIVTCHNGCEFNAPDRCKNETVLENTLLNYTPTSSCPPKDSSVPEFGMVGIIVVMAAGMMIIKRKRK